MKWAAYFHSAFTPPQLILSFGISVLIIISGKNILWLITCYLFKLSLQMDQNLEKDKNETRYNRVFASNLEFKGFSLEKG